jgi:hypothetical protein
LDRILDLLSNFFSREFGYQLALTFNDPPAALAGVFILLGLREMYVVYRRESMLAKRTSPQEIWQTEHADSAG